MYNANMGSRRAKRHIFFKSPKTRGMSPAVMAMLAMAVMWMGGAAGSGQNHLAAHLTKHSPANGQTSPAPPAATDENWWPRKGSYLVALISTECSHCQQAVPQLNAYATAQKLPPLHAICYNQPFQVVEFRSRWKARFPVHRTSFQEFLHRLGTHNAPCVQWVVDGNVKMVVESPFPPPEELRQRIQRAGQPVAPKRKKKLRRSTAARSTPAKPKSRHEHK